MQEEVIAHSEQDTIELAKKIANSIKKQTIITLTGDLGSGKTFFTGALINELLKRDNLPAQHVTSPTFNLVKVYDLKNFSIYHYDLYRIKKTEELYELNIEEAFNNVAIIEWPELAMDILPYNPINVNIVIQNNTRIFKISNN